MNRSLKALVKECVPPFVVRSLKRRWGKGIRFAGHPASWAEACAQSSGYSSSEIVSHVAAATREVVSGRAVFERDSVLFHVSEYQYPLLSALLRSAALNGGRLSVVDFGGSLGSTYRQCQPFLRGLQQVCWQVVEQESFVEVGSREFATDELAFHRSLAEIQTFGIATVLLASSVLQYLESPASWVDRFSDAGAAFLVIDRTPFSDEGSDRLCIQHVPDDIYRASYPCWILSYPRMLASLSAKWRVLCEFPALDGKFSTGDGLDFSFRGLVLERIE